ncbi:MAG: flagellar hook-associated protein FlgL [Chloroflexi bacterium]|nr:flagellar hook-associated protein FlgL [Chloroflexota bacterium]
MRVTNRMLTDNMIANLRGNLQRLEDLHSQITTGTRLSRPSDDPPAVARTLTYTADIAAGEQYLETIDASLSWLGATDDTVASATSLLQRARELAVQGANGTLTLEQQTQIGTEIGEILNQMVATGNATHRGLRLFSGQTTDTDPFVAVGTPPTAVNFVGDTGQLVREFDKGVTIAINTRGDTTFGPAFNALLSLRSNLNAGNSQQISQNDIAAIDTAMDTLLTARAGVGAKMNRLDLAKDRQTLLNTNLQDLRSKTADTDYAEAISKFSIKELVYKASLEAGAKAIQPSLLDYLR